ncbi:MAG: hypothetical protein IT372_22670 [Polyangiaceae bacterium]|nr:hypothetical protein [Polyangiaceae bacterium]
MSRVAVLLFCAALCAACAGDDTQGSGGAPGTGGAGAGGAGTGGTGSGAGGGGGGAPAAGCEPLPPPAGNTITVTPADAGSLGAIAAGAQPGDTILLEDGTYPVSGDVVMVLGTPGVTLMSASRDASRVILDGGDYQAREIIQIVASGVTVAHVTIKHAQDHLIHLYPGGQEDLSGILLHGLRLEDAGQQFVKSNANEANADFAIAEFVDGVTVSCSSFIMSEAGRAYVPTNPHNASYPCYTGGIDAHAAAGWVVRQNFFQGIYCTDGGSPAEHAIHFWHSGRDQIIENNTVENCARGIGLGLYYGVDFVERPYADDPHAADKSGYVGNYDGIVRNNVVHADMPEQDSGMSFDQAIGARVYHNTVYLSGAAAGFSIEYRWPNSIVDMRNNIATDIANRGDGASGTVESNLLSPPAATFVDAAAHDFHLSPEAAAAIDQGVPLPEAGLDMDGEPHTSGPPDLGADER